MPRFTVLLFLPPGGIRTGGAASRARRAALLLFASLTAIAAAPPQRIVSTAPGITEILYALGLGDRVVGVTSFCHYPPEATRKTKIGDYLRPNLEAIVSLRPDLVVIESTGIRSSEPFGSLKLRTLEISDGTIAGVYDAIQRIAAAAGVPASGAALTDQMRSELTDIQQRTRALPRRRAVFVVGRTPQRMEDIIVAGRGAHVTELIEIAGGANIFRDSVATYSKISLEELISRDPEVVIDMGEMAATSGVTEAQKRAVVELWTSRLPMLAAVRQKRIYAVASDIYVVPGPRITEAARGFARMLHPEAGF